MKEETIKLRKLIAADGMILYNGEAFGREVILSTSDSPENWREITKAEAEAIQKAWLLADGIIEN